MTISVHDMSKINGTQLGHTTRVRKEIGREKQRNSQEERTTENGTFGINYTIKITGQKLVKNW